MTGMRVDSRAWIASEMAVESTSATRASTAFTTSAVSSNPAGSGINGFIKRHATLTPPILVSASWVPERDTDFG
jgi:hypothetical protein